MVFSGAAGSWVFCASAVDNNRTKKIGRMAMRRSISGSFIFVKASMNTPAGQFCANGRLIRALSEASLSFPDTALTGKRPISHLKGGSLPCSPDLSITCRGCGFSVCRGRCRYSATAEYQLACYGPEPNTQSQAQDAGTAW